MKFPRLVPLLCLVATVNAAEPTFPGLKTVLTPAEWARAGLDRLSPDELGVIDAALIRHQAWLVATHQGELEASRKAAVAAAAGAPVAQATFGQPPADAPRGWLERFGLPLFNDTDWRTLPPLRAKVVAWESANRFRLDNGQVWEGFEPIRHELVGKNIEIQARPGNQFALSVEGLTATNRVIRIR